MKIFVFDLDGTVIKKTLARYFWYFVVPYIYLEKRGTNFYDAISFLLKAYKGDIDGFPKYGTMEWHYVDSWFRALFGYEGDPIEFVRENFKDFDKRFLDHFEFEEGFLEIIENIRNKYKVFLLTNIDFHFYREFLEDKVSGFFDRVYLTHEIKKPKEEILREIKSEFQNFEIFYIGDEISDVKSSKKAGVTGILYDKYDRYSYHPKIRNLLELRRWI